MFRSRSARSGLPTTLAHCLALKILKTQFSKILEKLTNENMTHVFVPDTHLYMCLHLVVLLKNPFNLSSNRNQIQVKVTFLFRQGTG